MDPIQDLEARNYEENPRRDYPQRPGKFNWGAFFYCIPWGIANHCYIPLLALIPGLNLVIIILSGFKGNKWAMEKNTYRDMEEFSRIQETWNRAGKFMFFISLVIFIVVFALAMLGIFTVPDLMESQNMVIE